MPAKLTLLGADSAIPPVYVCVPPALPKASVPVLRKDTALVIVPVLPLSATLTTVLGTVKVGVVRAPLKVIVPVVLVRTTLVPVVTAPVKVAPPELLTVRVAKLTPPPIAPLTLIVPGVFRVKDWVLAVVPLILLKLIAPLLPLPVLVSVVFAPKVTAPV